MTKQRLSATFFSATFGFTTLALACGLQPPVQNGGAAVKDGIQVAVLRQSCSQTVETEQPGNDLVETTLEVEVRNGASTPIAVHGDGFRLGAPDGSAIRTSTWGANQAVALDPGRTQTFQLRFMSRGGLSCYREMTLESPSAVVRGTEPVQIGAVKVVPAHAPTGYGRSAS
jgi:hypothetical protein